MYKLILSYDGTQYFGWQKTRSGPSIQLALEKALLVLGKADLPEAASRTDRGVHARKQVVSFSLDREIEPKRLVRALNAHLPPDIRVLAAEKMAADFHPTLDAKGKEYHYEVCLGPVQLPRHRLYSWHYPYSISWEKMQQGADLLVGSHDFSAFTTIRPKNPLCTLEAISFEPLEQNRLRIRLIADRFLYRMARTLAGTLLYLGSGKLPLEQLFPKHRSQAGVTAPPHALFLHQIFY